MSSSFLIFFAYHCIWQMSSLFATFYCGRLSFLTNVIFHFFLRTTVFNKWRLRFHFFLWTTVYHVVFVFPFFGRPLYFLSSSFSPFSVNHCIFLTNFIFAFQIFLRTTEFDKCLRTPVCLTNVDFVFHFTTVFYVVFVFLFLQTIVFFPQMSSSFLNFFFADHCI